MSKLSELIEKLCPEGVEYKKLWEITSVSRGKRLTKKDLIESGYPVYHGSLVPLGYYKDYNNEGDTVIVVNTGGIGGVGYCNDKFWCSDGCFVIDKCSALNNKYVYYFLSRFKQYFIGKIRTGGVPTIDKSTVLDILIPIPPLPIQNEIVRILDSLTFAEEELIKQLEDEIKARKQQYEYYRNKLLTFKRKN